MAECVVCNDLTNTITDCGHFLCKECYSRIYSNECPLCKKYMSRLITVYCDALDNAEILQKLSSNIESQTERLIKISQNKQRIIIEIEQLNEERKKIEKDCEEKLKKELEKNKEWLEEDKKLNEILLHKWYEERKEYITKNIINYRLELEDQINSIKKDIEILTYTKEKLTNDIKKLDEELDFFTKRNEDIIKEFNIFVKDKSKYSSICKPSEIVKQFRLIQQAISNGEINYTGSDKKMIKFINKFSKLF
jgi:chromosome segregation ATPase